ncbi:50S ribosomal protein L11 methyltransferase [Streptomyces sp. S.PNR 29]|uniref:50S ribosomal protein L11 methyltransferase n=1 Tax=Streptomyces sp. S.PNR 29 TaxID=2973805 RepID=UPI0025AF9586|nr:50S ribosomal protein L11 methyltransferase [Streptomyces sp. S.PNR 29]MDN0195308.1 50S ribosomal protein L11 methyltransferase [Streptomyces sp. S.PNR 29]
MITKDTVLTRRADLIVQLDGANTVRVHHGRVVSEFGRHALALLDAFWRPRTVAEALRLLGPRLVGGRALDEVVSTLGQLVSAGVLAEEHPVGFTDLMFPVGGYGMAYPNIRMLDDPLRKRLFVRAVKEVVRPGDVVLDLGTGSGILAVAAAQAGARRVYAVEPAQSAGLAQAVADRNGVADRITFLRDWSTSVELPEKADVLTTDIVGNDALDMAIWETVQDARERLLAPGARLVPESITASARLVRMPPEHVAAHRVVPAHVEEWNARYGMDFTPLLEHDRDRVAGFYEPPTLAAQWPRLSPATPLYEVDLHRDARVFTGTAEVVAERAGVVNGVTVHFEARLSPGTVLSTDPVGGCDKSHWFTAGWVFPQEVEVVPGTAVTLSYHYTGDGRATVELADRTAPQEVGA